MDFGELSQTGFPEKLWTKQTLINLLPGTLN
jgi:hypothetical protein